MTPTLGGSINETFFAEYDATVQAALASGSNVHVLLDVVSHFHFCSFYSAHSVNLPDAVCNRALLSTTMLDGTAKSLRRVVPRTPR